MNYSHKHLLWPLLMVAPAVSFAHADHTLLEETMLFLGSNPIALLAIAPAVGAVTGGVVFLFRHDKKKAFNSGIALIVLSATLLFVLFGTSANDPLPLSGQQLSGAVATVYKSATCGCCGGYIEELKRQGASVNVQIVSEVELAKIKIEHDVARELQSCHTSIIDGYVVEGHVPIEAVAKLRAERPQIKGIALPGMPIGTPGMPGPKLAPYDVQTLEGKAYLKI